MPQELNYQRRRKMKINWWNVCSPVILWALNHLKPVGEWAAEVRGVSVSCVCTALCFLKEPGASEEDHYSIKKHFRFQVGIREKSLGRNLKEIKWKETRIEFQKTQVWSSGSCNGNRKRETWKKRSPLLKISFMLPWKGCHGQRKRKLSTMLGQVCIPLCHLVPDKAGKYMCKRKHLQSAPGAGVDTKAVSNKTISVCSFAFFVCWESGAVKAFASPEKIVDYSIMLLE